MTASNKSETMSQQIIAEVRQPLRDNVSSQPPLVARLWHGHRGKIIFICCTPLFAVPLTAQECGALFTAVLMALWWTTEAAPFALTALLPVVLLPALGVATADSICQQYFSDTVFLFLGTYIMAMALQRSHLHNRLALALIVMGGASPSQVLAGFPLVSLCFCITPQGVNLRSGVVTQTLFV